MLLPSNNWDYVKVPDDEALNDQDGILVSETP